jgi:hypothetical protein
MFGMKRREVITLLGRGCVAARGAYAALGCPLDSLSLRMSLSENRFPLFREHQGVQTRLRLATR